jgi:hypothetical protein
MARKPWGKEQAENIGERGRVNATEKRGRAGKCVVEDCHDEPIRVLGRSDNENATNIPRLVTQHA